MEETTVPIFKSPNSKSSSLVTPNINYFDCTWKKTMEAISVTEQTNRRSSIRLSTDFCHIEKNSLTFLNLNASDVGRESLGILPPDFGRDSLGFMNISNLDTNRESLGILHISALKDFGRESSGFLTSDFGKESLGFSSINKTEANRESLGIIQINSLRDSLSFRRESLGILNLQDLDRESLGCGRESLGILHLKSPDGKFEGEEKSIPDLILTSTQENSYEPNNILDTAFLQPNIRKSTLSSISSFNSLWLDGPSRIYSVSSVKTDLSNDTSISVFSANSYNTELSSVHSLFNKGKIFSPSELDVRSRIQSVPDKLTPSKQKMEKQFWSADRTTKQKSVDRSCRECIDFEGADRSSELHDSVFIKDNSAAENVIDGSNESFACGALDCTSEPEWPDEISSIDKKENDCKKCDTETAFKTVDKMLPQPTKEILDFKLTSKIDDNVSSENVEKIKTKDDSESKISEVGEQNISKLLHNISDIQHESRKNSFIQKQPKEILENLSVLLNCTNPSDKQKLEGQSLLNALADMLCESKSSTKNNFDDSGHSSINEHSDSPNNKDQECFEVLDLRLKGTGRNVCNKKILDLSLKSKAIDDIKDKRLSRSLCLPSPNKKVFSDPGIKSESASSLHFSNNSKSSNSSANSNDSKNISALIKSNIAGKLRQKPCSSGLKKGPMKAIIPVGEMRKKNKTPVTPERSEQKVPNMQSKRTSTPINDPKLKPIAASTPSYSTKESRLLNKKSADSSLVTSKTLNASSNSNHSKADISGLPRASTTNVGCRLRTNSLGDIKKPSEMSWRRNSVGKESSIMSSVSKARQSAGSLYYKPMKQNSEIELQNKGKLDEKRTKLGNIESKSTSIKNTMLKKPKQNSFTAGSLIKIYSSPQLKNNVSTSSQYHSNTKSGIQYGKKNAPGIESGRKSCLSQIKQNLLNSPHFNLEKENSVLSENQELNKINQTGIPKCSPLKKAGKENNGL